MEENFVLENNLSMMNSLFFKKLAECGPDSALMETQDFSQNRHRKRKSWTDGKKQIEWKNSVNQKNSKTWSLKPIQTQRILVRQTEW